MPIRVLMPMLLAAPLLLALSCAEPSTHQSERTHPTQRGARTNPKPTALTQRIHFDGRDYDMVLTPTSFRNQNFQVLVQQADGTFNPIDAGPERTYLGTVKGKPDSVACAYKSADGHVYSFVTLDRGLMFEFKNSTLTESRPVSNVFYSFPSEMMRQSESRLDGVRELNIAFECIWKAYLRAYKKDVIRIVEDIEKANCLSAGMYLQNLGVKPTVGRVIIRASKEHDVYGKPGQKNPSQSCIAYWRKNHKDSAFNKLAILRTGGGGVSSAGGPSFTVGCSRGLRIGVYRHELGHTMGIQDFHADSPEGPTTMCGNTFVRFAGPSVNSVLWHCSRWDKSLRNLGDFDAVNLPPYAALDTERVIRGSRASLSLSVLTNDFDVNQDSLAVSKVDQRSARGIPLTVNGNEIVYAVPSDRIGQDHLTYQVTDSAGKTATGLAIIDIVNPYQEYPVVVKDDNGKTLEGRRLDKDESHEWTVDASYAGEYTLRIQYSLHNKPQEVLATAALSVNGTIVEPDLYVPSTFRGNRFNYLMIPRVRLRAGSNTVSLTAKKTSDKPVHRVFLKGITVHEGLQARINFQPPVNDSAYKSNIHDACRDQGETFGPRGYGPNRFGWNRDMTKRGKEHRVVKGNRWYTTGIKWEPGAIWEMALEPGTYHVRVVCCDGALEGDHNTERPAARSLAPIQVESVTVKDVDASDYFANYETTVDVKDGKLTLSLDKRNGGQYIHFVEVASAIKAE